MCSTTGRAKPRHKRLPRGCCTKWANESRNWTRRAACYFFNPKTAGNESERESEWEREWERASSKRKFSQSFASFVLLWSRSSRKQKKVVIENNTISAYTRFQAWLRRCWLARRGGSREREGLKATQYIVKPWQTRTRIQIKARAHAHCGSTHTQRVTAARKKSIKHSSETHTHTESALLHRRLLHIASR